MNTKQALLSLLLLLVSLSTQGRLGFTYEGIHYSCDDKTQTAWVAENSGLKYDIVIPSYITIEGTTYTVNGAGYEAFAESYHVSSLTIPPTFESFSYYSHVYDMAELEAVYISDLAAWCKIDFVQQPLEIAHHLYLNGVEIKDLVIPNSVTTISSRAFSGGSNIGSIVIPNSVTSIGEYSFGYCEGVTKIVSEIENPFGISEYTFDDTTYSTAELIVPKGTKGAYMAAEGWKNFKNITEAAGSENDSFTVGTVIFIVGDNNIVSVGVDNNATGAYEIPSVVWYSGANYQVTKIGDQAFKDNTGLTQVTIPSTIINIGSGAFAGCTGLHTIIIHVTTPIALSAGTRADGSGVFEGVDLSQCTLYVPAESVDAYKSASVWKDFGQILPIGSTSVGLVPTVSPHQDVYDLQGRRILSGAESLDGLPKGMYIVNGRKVVVP